MHETMQVLVERGPQGRKVAAFAADWQGLERGGKTEDDALRALAGYLARYEPIVRTACAGSEPPLTPAIEVVERYDGPGSTDFWGISFGFSNLDHRPLEGDELERLLCLLGACWTSFDDVRHRVSAELCKGPRGGGRNRDTIVRHVAANEQDWGKKLGLPAPAEVVVDDDGLARFRKEYLAAIRQFPHDGRSARNWPLRYLIRHTAYHVLDHTWEMEDKDLTGPGT